MSKRGYGFFCEQCGTEAWHPVPVTPNGPCRRFCDECKRLRNIEDGKERRKRYKANGLCSICGGMPDGGTLFCAKCRDRTAARNENTRRKREERAGRVRCPTCDQLLPEDA